MPLVPSPKNEGTELLCNTKQSYHKHMHTICTIIMQHTNQMYHTYTCMHIYNMDKLASSMALLLLASGEFEGPANKYNRMLL